MADPAHRLVMPAEWAPHTATWLAWPHDPLTWAAGVEPAENAFLDMIEAIAPGERVELIVHDHAQAEHVSDQLATRGLEAIGAPEDHAAAAAQDLPASGLVRLHAGSASLGASKRSRDDSCWR